MVICCYNTHTNMSEHFMGERGKVADKALIKYNFITIIGDLNNNSLLPKCEVNKHLFDFMNSHVMKNIINEPTCFKTLTGTLLDVIVTSNSNRFLKSGSLNTGLSDTHHLVYGVLRTGFTKDGPRRVCYRSFKNFNVDNYNADVAQAPFHVMEIFEDIDDFTWFYDKMHRDILDSHAPLKSRIIRPNQPRFMNSALRKAAHRKAQLQNKANRFTNTIDFETYRVQRNKTTSIRHKAIKGFHGENCNVNCRNNTN